MKWEAQKVPMQNLRGGEYLLGGPLTILNPESHKKVVFILHL